jgi:aminopeptidase N
MELEVHCFEKSGLGKAPFRCVGVASLPSPSLAEHNPDAYNNALRMLPRDIGLGSCNYCGMAIMHNFIIEDCTGGKRFVVGSDCVARTGDAGLIKAVRGERLKVVRAKREVIRSMKRSEREAQWAKEREERRVAFLAANAELLADAAPFMEQGGFIADVLERGTKGGFVSDRALQAVADAVANRKRQFALKASSRHVATVGARVTLKVTVERVAHFTRASYAGYGVDTVWIITMRDEAGNAIVSKSTAFHAERNQELTIKATVKAHDEYEGEQQTVVQRIKEVQS